MVCYLHNLNFLFQIMNQITYFSCWKLSNHFHYTYIKLLKIYDKLLLSLTWFYFLIISYNILPHALHILALFLFPFIKYLKLISCYFSKEDSLSKIICPFIYTLNLIVPVISMSILYFIFCIKYTFVPFKITLGMYVCTYMCICLFSIILN